MCGFKDPVMIAEEKAKTDEFRQIKTDVNNDPVHFYITTKSGDTFFSPKASSVYAGAKTTSNVTKAALLSVTAVATATAAAATAMLVTGTLGIRARL